MIIRVDRVAQLQQQLLVHSYLYYIKDDPIWTDTEYDKACKELLTLNQAGSPYEELFKDFDGSTGYHLAYAIPRKLVGTAHNLLQRWNT